MKKFIPHRFWVDGVLYRDIETYRGLSTWIIKESMRANGLTFRKNNKKEYIKIWLKYFESIGEEPINPFATIAETIFAEREICHKTQNHKMSSRYSNTVRFRIMKQLEQF
jgi:hypothetical protein